jgi:hypothetical protein
MSLGAVQEVATGRVLERSKSLGAQYYEHSRQYVGPTLTKTYSKAREYVDPVAAAAYTRAAAAHSAIRQELRKDKYKPYVLRLEAAQANVAAVVAAVRAQVLKAWRSEGVRKARALVRKVVSQDTVRAS